MTNKEFETKCLAVLDGTATPVVRREVVVEAACLRSDYIDSIRSNDIWDQEHPRVSYDRYAEDDPDDDGEYETDDALIEWAKTPTAFLREPKA